MQKYFGLSFLLAMISAFALTANAITIENFDEYDDATKGKAINYAIRYVIGKLAETEPDKARCTAELFKPEEGKQVSEGVLLLSYLIRKAQKDNNKDTHLENLVKRIADVKCKN
jgi:hypothetical protein